MCSYARNKKKPTRPLVAWVGLLLAFFTACSNSPTPEELASEAAKNYYRQLAAGQYEQFLDGRAGADSLHSDYREQLLVAYKQFVAQQQATHRGIREVRIMNARADSLQGCTNVFLVLCFGDSTNEEIVVPMVERGQRWLMK